MYSTHAQTNIFIHLFTSRAKIKRNHLAPSKIEAWGQKIRSLEQFEKMNGIVSDIENYNSGLIIG